MTTPLGMFGPTGQASGLKGTGYKQIKTPTMNRQQSDLTSMLHQLLGQGGFGKGLSQLGNIAGGDQETFNQLEAPALRQFGALQGNIASRFSGMGGSGARRSSGFQNSLGEAGASLAEQLQSQRMGYQQQALQQLMGLSESLLGRPTFENMFMQKQLPFWKQLGIAGAGGLGNLLSSGGQLGLAKGVGLI